MPIKPFTRLDPVEKVSETGTHLFFLKGPFSQWHPSDFQMSLRPGGPLLKFNCAEQYMMAAKAHLFGDNETLEKIMAVQQQRSPQEAPKQQKALGREVKGFDPAVWNEHARPIVFRGNWAKFAQNADMAERLDLTFDKHLVEGAHYDPVWGVGLAWDDPAITDPANWKGTNWLGLVLMAVRGYREEVSSIIHMSPYTTFDPWTRQIT